MNFPDDGGDRSHGLAHSKTVGAARDLGSARVLLGLRDPLARRLISNSLEERGYTVVMVTDTTSVIPALETNAVDVVLLDADLPTGGGLEAVRGIRHDLGYSDLPILLLGESAAHADPTAGIDAGVDDYIVKPVQTWVLVERVRVALRMRRALLGVESAFAVVSALANALDENDPHTQLHTERLGSYASQLGRRVGLSAADLHAVTYGTLLHDLGRLGVPDSILSKAGPLTDDEQEVMKQHTEIGARIAAPLIGSERFGPIIRHHHERWDGQGYPDGLSGDAIPIGARIIAVVDAFDAMTQPRVYRSPRPVPQALEELRTERGKQFDPEMVNAFASVLEWDGLD